MFGQTFQIRLATDKDSGEILEHIRNTFFRDEPVNSSINLAEAYERSVESEECAIDCLNQGISFVAVTETSKIIGICLNELIQRGQPPADIHCTNPKLQKIFQLLACLNVEGRVFEKFPNVNQIICVNIISLIDSWRGRGVAKELLHETSKLAKLYGISLLRIDCTNEYSARAVKKLGFECVYTKKYADYLENGKPVFNPDQPHDQATIYVKSV